MSKKVSLLVTIGVFIWGFSFLFLLPRVLFNQEEAENCRNFLLKNSTILDYFGVVKSVEPQKYRLGKRRYSNGEVVSGAYRFVIKGSKKTEVVKIYWVKSNNIIEPNKISMREGLLGERILWPESEATLPNYLLPSYVWDGFSALVMAILSFILYFDASKNGKIIKVLSSLSPINEWMKSAKKYYLITGIVGLILSILCFMRIISLV